MSSRARATRKGWAGEGSKRAHPGVSFESEGEPLVSGSFTVLGSVSCAYAAVTVSTAETVKDKRNSFIGWTFSRDTENHPWNRRRIIDDLRAKFLLATLIGPLSVPGSMFLIPFLDNHLNSPLSKK
jgi:hypothetical protein